VKIIYQRLIEEVILCIFYETSEIKGIFWYVTCELQNNLILKEYFIKIENILLNISGIFSYSILTPFMFK
jgi:hypothetical protein